MAADWLVQAEAEAQNLGLVEGAEVVLIAFEMCFGVVRRNASVKCSQC